MNMLKILSFIFLVIFQFASSFAVEKRDSTIKIITTWRNAPYSLDKEFLPLDTMLFDIQTINPIQHYSFSNTYTGNLGAASESNIFALRNTNLPFIFLSPIQDYLTCPEKVNYFNTNKPFTTITYTTGGATATAEQTLRVIHTQNIKKYLNVGLNYNLINSVGQYQNQSTKCNSFSFFSNFEHPKYSLATNLNYNKFIIDENGGITNDSVLGKTSFTAATYPVNLITQNNSVTNYRNVNYYLIHRYIVGRVNSKLKRDTTTNANIDLAKADSSDNDMDTIQPEAKRKYYQLAFSHVLQYERDIRSYTDNSLAPATSFYKDWFTNTNLTHDSLYYRRFYNMFRMELLPDSNNLIKLGARAGISSENIRYNYDKPNKVDTIINSVDTVLLPNKQRSSKNENNLYFSFQLFDDVSKTSNWTAEAKYCFEGYNVGAKQLNAHFFKKIGTEKKQVIFKIFGEYNDFRPDFLYSNFYSNHFSWENGSVSDKKVRKTAFDFDVEIPVIKFNAGINYTLLSNWIYLSGTAADTMNNITLNQSTDQISILMAHLEKTISFWKFRLVNKIVYQKPSTSEIQLPDLTFYNSTIFENTVIKNVLDIELGCEVFYFTKFYIDGYMPGLGMFYKQSEKAVGNYPQVNAFFNFKLKRARIFLKLDHFNSGFSGNGYFSALHYPMNSILFKYGVSWSFYD